MDPQIWLQTLFVKHQSPLIIIKSMIFGYPQFSETSKMVHFRLGFSLQNHPAIGVPPRPWKPWDRSPGIGPTWCSRAGLVSIPWLEMLFDIYIYIHNIYIYLYIYNIYIYIYEEPFTNTGICKYLSIPIGSMYAIYGNIYHQYTPVMLAYIYHTWILWVYDDINQKNSRWGLKLYGSWGYFDHGGPTTGAAWLCGSSHL